MMKRKPRILVVDDSASARHHYCELLEKVESEVQTASNGHEALTSALSAPFDLIITDVNMPEMNGIELCRALQTTPSTRDIPIVIVSTFDSDKDVEMGFDAGASAYLSKNDVDALFVSTISEILWKYLNVRQRRILVVDDSKSIARFIEVELMKHSFQVIVAGSGKIAKDLLGKIRPDLILSDIKMPDMDGFALCKWIKSASELSEIPFIAMSSAEEASVVQRIIQYGAAAYILKPFSMNQLVPLIDRILSDHFRIILKERERLDAERVALVNSITSLVAALEARDSYTKGHSEAVSVIATQLLMHSGADKSDIDLISIGGRLHDIGKIGIRDSVLLKPDRLTAEEFNHIKAHPTIGKTILAVIPSLAKIIPIAYSHHERWDGKGYPQGLKGETIPFWARLTSVADTFDALISCRPYRKGMSYDQAFQIIKDARGTQLCPESVDIFLKYIETEDINGTLLSSFEKFHPPGI